MARARNIKPGFFKNEALVELPFEHRLLFVGLWTLADKAGRLEDRVKRIKMELFPADNVDVEAGMTLLERYGFIQRYEINGMALVQILNFSKHQSPHHTEKNSELPDPNGELTVKEPKKESDSPKPLRGNPPDSLIHGFTDSLNTDSKDTASVPDADVAVDSKKVKSTAKPEKFELPGWLDAETWAMWDQFRKTKSARGWTPQAKALSLKSLEKLKEEGHQPTAVIEQSIERGWTGLFEVKAQFSGKPSAHTGFAKQDYHKGVAADGSF